MVPEFVGMSNGISWLGFRPKTYLEGFFYNFFFIAVVHSNFRNWHWPKDVFWTVSFSFSLSIFVQISSGITSMLFTSFVTYFFTLFLTISLFFFLQFPFEFSVAFWFRTGRVFVSNDIDSRLRVVPTFNLDLKLYVFFGKKNYVLHRIFVECYWWYVMMVLELQL